MTEVDWRRSTFCASGSCVECKTTGRHVLIRDGKLDDDSPILSVSKDAWRTFIGAVKEDAFTA